MFYICRVWNRSGGDRVVGGAKNTESEIIREERAKVKEEYACSYGYLRATPKVLRFYFRLVSERYFCPFPVRLLPPSLHPLLFSLICFQIAYCIVYAAWLCSYPAEWQSTDASRGFIRAEICSRILYQALNTIFALFLSYINEYQNNA